MKGDTVPRSQPKVSHHHSAERVQRGTVPSPALSLQVREGQHADEHWGPGSPSSECNTVVCLQKPVLYKKNHLIHVHKCLPARMTASYACSSCRGQKGALDALELTEFRPLGGHMCIQPQVSFLSSCSHLSFLRQDLSLTSGPVEHECHINSCHTALSVTFSPLLLILVAQIHTCDIHGYRGAPCI